MSENSHLFFEMSIFKNKKFEIKVKFFVNINSFGSFRTQCIFSINAYNTDKIGKDSNLESYKVDSEISEILRIKEFKLEFPFLKAHSISNIANENIEFDEIHQISDQISKGRQSNNLYSFNHFRFGDQFQLQEKINLFSSCSKTFGKIILNQ